MWSICFLLKGTWKSDFIVYSVTLSMLLAFRDYYLICKIRMDGLYDLEVLLNSFILWLQWTTLIKLSCFLCFIWLNLNMWMASVLFIICFSISLKYWSSSLLCIYYFKTEKAQKRHIPFVYNIFEWTMQRQEYDNRLQHIHISLLYTNKNTTMLKSVSVKILLSSYGVMDGNLLVTMTFFTYLLIFKKSGHLIKNSK